MEGVCKHCPEMCQDCIHEKTCKECMPESFLYKDTCHQSCPSHFYADARHCVPCHEDCLECSGPSMDDCDVCAEASLVLYDGQCLEECPEGTYFEKETKVCKDCHKSCRTCSSSGACTTCQEGLRVNNHGGCVPHTECAAVEYWDEGALTCKACHAKCFHCTGPSEDQCHTCLRDSLLLNTTCVQDCPEGYYADEDSHRVVPAGKGVSAPVQRRVLRRKLHGAVREGEKFNCEKCHESCIECKGPGTKNCTVCPANLVLHMDDSRCLHCCNTSDPTDVQECCDCHDTTDECILRASEVEPAGEPSKTALFITSSVMLVFLLGAAVIVWRKSRGRVRPTEKAGYAKLADPSKSYSSYKGSHRESTSFAEDQVIEYRDRDDDEDDEDDIVYMGQDGTVYRKFKYGLLDDDDEDELEYDDESYSYQQTEVTSAPSPFYSQACV
ncbi:hypothetical protein J1605_010270 [Eschrichtius robustus]|uniref:Proprotein convertase subtilisin/kexin type 5 n=1 Tax=Eschrichtius robustus TaxID=9764 RepID=A0AB34GPD3_ESCRO|nr:hypothetical protein J1605_010270 [Eschrichtius robustus]